MSQLLDNWRFIVTLKDGTLITLRPVRPEDAPQLRDLHARLSPESRYFRFSSARTELPIEQAQELANVDHRSRMAFVAIPRTDETRIIGVARYGIADPGKPNEADAAIVVEDCHQAHGIGSALLEKLIGYARAQGIEYFIANVDSMNTKMLKLIQRANLPTEMKLKSGVWDIRVRITDTT